MRGALVSSVVVAGMLVSAAMAQDRKAPELPADPAAWINSPPLTPEALSGKGVVLFFFEEGCPRCAARWPDMLEISRKYEGKPVLFVGVNSGTPRTTIESYVQKHKITWPVVLDYNRTLETAFNTGEISLSNIFQARVIFADGTWDRGDYDELEAEAERVAKDAQWRVDPTKIPMQLQAAWLSIEFGDFATSALAVQRARKATKPELKEAGELLQGYVQGKLDEELKVATGAFEADQKWEAYKAYQQIATRFKGYPLPGEVEANLKKLGSDPMVEKESKAQRILQTVQKSLNGTTAGQKRATALAEKIRKDYPGTEAATIVEKLLQGDAAEAKP